MPAAKVPRWTTYSTLPDPLAPFRLDAERGFFFTRLDSSRYDRIISRTNGDSSMPTIPASCLYVDEHANFWRLDCSIPRSDVTVSTDGMWTCRTERVGTFVCLSPGPWRRLRGGAELLDIFQHVGSTQEIEIDDDDPTPDTIPSAFDGLI